MFTGIIQKTGPVVLNEGLGSSGLKLTVGTGFSDLTLGESVAVNGVCLTVAELPPKAGSLASSEAGRALFFVSIETLERTNLGSLQTGSRVNLERALLASERLSGHIVQGHVDGLARLHCVEMAGESRRVRFELPAAVARFCVEKGSITLDGVSLTINSLSNTIDPTGAPTLAEIMLIPHTWEHTRFCESRPGDLINVEVDILAKYVEKLCLPYQKPLTT